MANRFTFGPAVADVKPGKGPSAGGTSVTITGSDFTGTTAVEFGSEAAANFKVGSDTEITALSPPGTGIVDVTVTTPIATSPISAADQFSYVPPAQEGNGNLIELVNCRAVKHIAVKWTHGQRKMIKVTKQICTSKLISKFGWIRKRRWGDGGAADAGRRALCNGHGDYQPCEYAAGAETAEADHARPL